MSSASAARSGTLRVAWFSPMPPVRSGVATCSADLLPRLREHVSVDVFTGSPQPPPGCASAHEFVPRHAQQPYDVIVYQLGNSAHHAWQWGYLFRYPGLVVLHDAQLHHVRAASLLQARRADDYRAEFCWSHPGVSPDLAELAVHGFDNHLYYSWPMARPIVQASRLLAVHGQRMQGLLQAEYPQRRIEAVRLGHGEEVPADVRQRARDRIRRESGIPPDAIVFGCFGTMAPEKRLPAILAAFARTRVHVPTVRLLLAGGVASHYDLQADIQRYGVADAVTVTGHLEADDDFTAHISACDVGLNLRWPTAREISGPWLRCLAAGTPTIITHLRHLTHVPALDPRSWQPYTQARDGDVPVCIAIDLLDEDHSLRLAMRRLAGDVALRHAIAQAGLRYWSASHTVEKMLEDYLRLIRLTAGIPPPRVALPNHLSDHGDRVLREILEPFSLESPI